MDLEQDLVVVRLGRNGVAERREQRLRQGRHFRPRRCEADEDLRARLVQAGALVPHDRHRDHRGRRYGRPVSESLREPTACGSASSSRGPRGSIADVPGVLVGQATIRRTGRAVARTGVTAIVPAAPATLRSEPLAAGVAVLNGAGEMTGSLQVAEWGVIETPIYLTATRRSAACSTAP